MRMISRFADRYQWILLVLVAPFLLFPSPIRTLALLVIPLGWIISWAAWGAPFPRTPLNTIILVMAIMVLVSTWATYDLTLSLPKITGMMLAFSVYFAFSRYGATPNGWKLCLGVFFLIGLGIAGASFIGTKWYGGKFGFIDAITSRLPSSLAGLAGAQDGFHPNEVAGALLWVLPPLIFYSAGILLQTIIPQKGKKRQTLTAFLVSWLLILVSGLVALFTLGVFLLTQSRGGYVGLAISILVVLWLGLPARWKAVFLAILIVGTILAGVLIWQAGSDSLSSLLFGSSTPDNPALSANSLEGRLEIWSRAIYGIQDFPFTGMGMNTFRKIVHILYPLFLISPEVDLGHAHNEFLQAALDLGIPGLMAFLALYFASGAMLANLMRSILKNRGPALIPNWSYLRMFSLVLGLGGGLLAHMLYGLTDAVALGSKPGVMFWMILGLITSLHTRLRSLTS